MGNSLYNKFNAFAALAFNGGDINLSTDTVKVMLTATQPVATNAGYSDVNSTELASGGGYTTGGATLTLVSSGQVGGLYKYIATTPAPTWTGNAGGMGPFRYAIVYDSTATGQPLMGWFDFGQYVTLTNAQPFTLTLDQVNGLLTLS